MEILKRGILTEPIKIVKCEYCKSIIKVKRSDCNVTSQLAVMHDGIGAFNFNCPVCRANIDFDYFDGEEVIK